MQTYEKGTRTMTNSEMVHEIINRYGSVNRFLGATGKVTHMERKDGDLWVLEENKEASKLTQQAYMAETMEPTGLTVEMPEEGDNELNTQTLDSREVAK